MSTEVLEPRLAPRDAEPVAHTHTARGRLGSWLLSLAVLALLCLASIAIGSQTLPLATVFHALLHPGHTNADLIVTDLRIPRTVLGLLVGAALGVAGALMQALTRNPLADPGVLGVDAGASLAVTVGIAYLGLHTIHEYIWPALLGAAITTVAVYAIGTGGRGGPSPARLVLAGVGLAAVFSGVTSMIALGNQSVFEGSLNWSAGSLAGRPLSTSVAVAPFIAVGLVMAAAISRDLNAIALGDDLAAALGSRSVVVRVVAVAAITLLAGAATAAAGPIAFVGLMIPRIARWITGPDQRWILAFSLTLGPCLLIASDVIGRIVMSPSELPVGIVTAFVGAPVLIFIARRMRTSDL
ncbi:MAG TPA: iron chelate uptake ABC transporter family permease subunit [Solirubrobacterales bacterium]